MEEINLSGSTTENASTENGTVETKTAGTFDTGETVWPDSVKTLGADIILESKQSGSITMTQPFDKLDKQQATPAELEEVYRIFERENSDNKRVRKGQRSLRPTPVRN